MELDLHNLMEDDLDEVDTLPDLMLNANDNKNESTSESSDESDSDNDEYTDLESIFLEEKEKKKAELKAKANKNKDPIPEKQVPNKDPVPNPAINKQEYQQRNKYNLRKRPYIINYKETKSRRNPARNSIPKPSVNGGVVMPMVE